MTETTASSGGGNAADWNVIVGGDTATAETSVYANLPDLPRTIGRLPINPDTKKAIVQFPEPIKGVSCAAVFANVSVVSDCYRDGSEDGECGNRQGVKHARPLNDREIEVVFYGNQTGQVVGSGWASSGGYPGAQLETRSVEIGKPFVEVEVVVSRNLKCGCDSEKWASDEWGA